MAQVVERIGIAHDIGLRTFQIALSPWGAVDDAEHLVFSKDTCGSFADAKFIHYNLPRSKRVLLGPECRQLEESVPNLAGSKNTRSDLDEIVRITTHTTDLQYFWGEYAFPIGCLYDECSLLSSFGGALFPAKTKAFFKLGVTG